MTKLFRSFSYFFLFLKLQVTVIYPVRISVLMIYSDDEHSLLFTAKMNIRYYLVLMNIRYSLQRG